MTTPDGMAKVSSGNWFPDDPADATLGSNVPPQVPGSGDRTIRAEDDLLLEVGGVVKVNGVALGGGPTVISQVTDFNYAKDGARHASSLTFTPDANTTYSIRIVGQWAGLAAGGEQYTLDCTVPAGASVIGQAVMRAGSTQAASAYTGGALGQAAAATDTAILDIVLANGAASTPFTLNVGDNSGGGTGLFKAGSTMTVVPAA